jgi:DNA repair protein RadC
MRDTEAPVSTGKRTRQRPATAYLPVSSPATTSTKRRLASSTDVWAEMAQVRSATQEHFVVYDLDVRHRIIATRIVHVGTLTGVETHPREVFRGAILNAAAAVILAHNHPSGDPTPSRQDLDLTRRLKEVGELCGIPVLDHVVVATEGFTSLAERGWL